MTSAFKNVSAIGYRLSAIGYRLSAIGYRLTLGLWLSLLITNQALAVDWTKEQTKIESCRFIQTFAGSVSGVCGYTSKKMGLLVEAHLGSISIGDQETGSNSFRIRCLDESDCIKRQYYDIDSGGLLCTTLESNDIIGLKKSEFLKLKSQAKNLAKTCATEFRSKEGREKEQRLSANQSRQMCEAQKATCFASCPARRQVHHTENALIVNGSYFDCKRRCENISCN